MAAPLYLGPPDGIKSIGTRGGGGGTPFDFGDIKPGHQFGPRPMPEPGGRPLTMGSAVEPATLQDAISRIALPPTPLPGELPGAVSGNQLLGMAPGADQLPGVGGFTNLMDSILGFGQRNPSYEDLFGPGGSISSQMGTYEGANPYQNMLSRLFGQAPGGNLYG